MRGRGGRNTRGGRGASRGSRGASRGGRGGSRRGRGGSRGRFVPKQQKQTSAEPHEEVELDINKDSVKYFTGGASFDQHYDAILANKQKYFATMFACEVFSIEISANAKARSLAAVLTASDQGKRDRETIDLMLYNEKQYGFTEVLKALTILDSARERRAIEKKIKRCEVSGAKIKPQKLGVLKRDINNLEKLKPKVGSVSGALCRHIKRWVRKFTKEELEYFAIQLPTEPWKKLANIVHLHPEKDFPAAPWFLPLCFGAEPPKDTVVDMCRQITAENVNEIVAKHDLPYSFLRKWATRLNDASKEKIAHKLDLTSVIWFYEELACPKVADLISSRLENKESVTFGYGKLMERLLMFKDFTQNSDATRLFSGLMPIAEQRVGSFISTIETPVAVMGDASGSMSVAIRTATIISSLLTVICSAKLSFFNTQNFYAKITPKNVAEVVDVAYGTNAGGGTANAASLVPYFDNKEIVKTFIMVTDEEENADGVTADGTRWRFYELFMKYRETVYPASLIFISFLSSQHSKGQMYSKFVDNKVTNVEQYVFSGSRPDLRKLDSILGKICSKTSDNFTQQIEACEDLIAKNGLIDSYKALNITANNDEP